jgi:hypothetical protein
MQAMPEFSSAGTITATPAQVAAFKTTGGKLVPKKSVSTPPPAASNGIIRFNENHYKKTGTILYSETQFDPRIQRNEETGLVNSIAKNWQESALGFVVISVRIDDAGNETYWSLDGQQRMLGTVKAGHPDHKFEAIFHFNLTFSEEAELFLALNNKKSVGAWDKFKNQINSGEPSPVAIWKLLQELNIPTNQVNGFNAWAMASRVAKLDDGVDHLRWALSLIQDLYLKPGDPTNIYDGALVESFARMHHRYGGNMRREMVLEKFARKGATLSYILGKGKDWARIQPKFRAVTALITAITEVYNIGLHSNSPKKLPAWTKLDGESE